MGLNLDGKHHNVVRRVAYCTLEIMSCVQKLRGVQFIGWSDGRKWGWFWASVGATLGAVYSVIRSVGVGMALES